MKRRLSRWCSLLAIGVLAGTATLVSTSTPAVAANALIPPGGVLRISVPEAVGGKTVIGQLAVDRASKPGFVTAYGCDDGLPRNAAGEVVRADLNYDGNVSPVWSNRLIVKADNAGDICLYTLAAVDMIIDINGVSFDTGISSFANRRSDTRVGSNAPKAMVAAGGVLRIAVPEAVGGKTVLGQLAVDHAVTGGFVTAYGCDDGLPRDAAGLVTKADLNYSGWVSSVWSNRLIVRADNDGDVCFYTPRPVDIIIDINGVADSGVSSFANRRSDTRVGANAPKAMVAAGGVLRIAVPEAVGGKTVIGQLAVDHATAGGFVTAYGCDDGLPSDPAGLVTKADLNYEGRATSVWSNRLIVRADNDGDVCFYTPSAVDMIIDINGVSSDIGIFSFPNRRTDTRVGEQPPVTSVPTDINGIPVWPAYTPLPALTGIAALTGEAASAATANRPILAVKIDNYWRARPQYGLDDADAIIEENVEGVTRFVALFHSRLPSDVGPVRSARTGDLDMLTAMNRPVFAYSGANDGVMRWIDSASGSGVLIDFTAQRNGCYRREATRPSPHNLLLDPTCAITSSAAAGPARPLWSIDAGWTAPPGMSAVADSTFAVRMDGVHVQWTWDAATGSYLRSQDAAPHVAASGARISARNVVEIFATHVPSPVDARSPNPITVGTGAAVVHRNGQAISGSWSRPTPYDPYVFREFATGALIPLNTGRTFIELVRDG